MTVEVKFESWQLNDEQFFQLCQDNRDLRLERNPKGDLIIMPPTGGETSNSNAGITAQLWLWNNLHKLGVVFDSSGGFKLPQPFQHQSHLAVFHHRAQHAVLLTFDCAHTN